MQVTANGIEIEYETLGDPAVDPLLLIMGLGGQLTAWDDELLRMLVDHGHFVIRFDNRDAGLSTKFDSAEVPNMTELMVAPPQGRTPDVPYLLDDMAEDAAGLLDALDIERTHVLGVSMGGMIAQTLAIRHPTRVKSLVSVMSATGDPDQPRSDPEVLAKLMTPPPPDREARIEQSVEIWRMLAGPGFPFDEDRARARSSRAYDRCFYPVGVGRQLAAIIASGSRAEALGRLNIPALVIHGQDDPLVPVGCGRMTAEAIPGAELLLIEGMGHDIPPALFETFTDEIAARTVSG